MNEDIFTVSESGGAPRRVGKRWLVTVARPGKGSTGSYSEDALKNTGPVAFPPGTKAFFNHDAKRDVRDMVGTYKQGAFWNEEEGELQAYLTPFPRYAPILDEAVDEETGQSYIEASIHSAARKDVYTGNVKELLYDRGNTIDLVAFAGLEGSGLKYQVESLFSTASAEEEQENNKEKNVEITKEMWDGLVAANTGLSAKFDTFVAESKASVQGVADEAAVETAVAARVEEALKNYQDVEKSINDADILTVQKEALKARAVKGEDITADLAEAVSFVAEAKKELTPEPKRDARGNVVVVNESRGSDTTEDFRVGRWS